MKDFEKAKQEYDSIPIPAELSERITMEIERAEKNKVHTPQQAKIIPFRRWTATAAALVLAACVTGLNTSQTFAREMEQIPVLGELAKILTFRTYEENTEDYIITVEIPTIEMISEEFSDLEDSVNAEIYTICEQFAEESKANALEYRQAFMETGGTLEEWLEHDIRINVSYAVQVQTDDYLSLAVKRTESWNPASAETRLFNLSLAAGEQITTEEIMEATDTTYYEDNFAVDAATAVAHAEKIQTAVAEQDLEALADLTAYPVYVGLDDGLVIENKEDFLALRAEQVFTEDLITSIANADTHALSPSRIGFVLSSDDTTVNIIFGVVDGALMISGINY